MARTPLFRNLKKLINSNISRRDFIKNSFGIYLAAHPLSNLVLPKPTIKNHKIKKVAIIGGGLAGLSTAYFLKRNGIQIHLFEASSRLGGRVFTKENLNETSMFGELGAELIDSNHSDLISLCKNLNLSLEALDFEGQHLQDSLYFFDNTFYHHKNIQSNLDPLIQRVYQDYLSICRPEPNPFKDFFDQMTLSFYLSSLVDYAEDWILKLFKVAYTGEFGMDADQQTALNFISMFGGIKNPKHIFGHSNEGFRVAGGNSKINHALIQNIEDKTTFYMNHHLRSIAETGFGISLTFEKNGSSVSKTFDHVILALPLSQLKSIDGLLDLNIHPEKKKGILEHGFGSNSKWLFSFDKPVWRGVHQSSGSFIFTDLESQSFWDTSRGQVGSNGILTNFTGGSFSKTLRMDQQSHIHSNLDSLWKDTNQFKHPVSYLANWSKTPFIEGSYSCAKPGQYWNWSKAWSDPLELNGGLGFAGEYLGEDYSGYMNGAVLSAKKVSAKLLEL